MSHASSMLTTSAKMPIIQKGISLARMNESFDTGVTFICSMVPSSFSCTILTAGMKPHRSMTTTTIRPGTIVCL